MSTTIKSSSFKNIWRKALLLSTMMVMFSSAAEAALLPLSVSPANRHFLQTSDGKPFFWMGDTIWGIRKLNDADLEFYLADRQAKKFNVIQINLRAEVTDSNGQTPYLNNNSDTPNAAAWSRIDTIISRAEARGMYVVFAPVWGNDYPKLFGTDAAKATRFGKWLGTRYNSRTNILWFVSGEYDAINNYTLPITAAQKNLFNAMAQGLEAGHGGKHLMTIHPGASYTSSLDFHAASWLDFNNLQSGHENNREAFGHPENHTSIARDYALSPIKPVLDSEPMYEGIPDGYYYYGGNASRPRAGADVMRRKAYWATFAGATGHTYGHVDVYSPVIPIKTDGQLYTWKQSINAPGAVQMKHLRNLLEPKGFSRVPDQSVLSSAAGTGLSHIRALRDVNGKYAMVYVPTGNNFTVNMSKIVGSGVKATWYDPRTGAYSAAENWANSGTHTFDPPGSPVVGNDWVLVLEAAGSGGATPKPDLVVTAFNYANGVFSATVKNIGTAATAAGLSPGILYSVDGAWKSWGYITQPIAVGASANIGAQGGNFVIPNGTHVIQAFVDNINQFAELNEGNNTLSQTIIVGAPKPDLIVTAFNYANGVFSATVKNQGTAATPAGLSPGILYSVDGAWKSWGYITQPIAAGASVNIGAQGGNYVIPSGTHTIEAFVDNINQFAELNEANNKLAKGITVGSTALLPPTILSPVSGVVVTNNLNKVTISWSAAAGATGYAVRMTDNQDGTIRDSRNSAGCAYVCIDSYTGTSITMNVRTGHTYSFWIHSRAGSGAFPGPSWSASKGINFSYKFQ